jgi:hypothetical protein
MTVFDKIAMVFGYLTLLLAACVILVSLCCNAVDWFWADRCPKCGARLKDKE